MITIAPKSSMIASAVKNTFKETGTLFPNNDKTPREKAISVAEVSVQILLYLELYIYLKLKNINHLNFRY